MSRHVTPASASARRMAIAPMSIPVRSAKRPNGWSPTPTIATSIPSPRSRSRRGRRARRSPTPVLLQIWGAAGQVPGRDRTQQTDERYDRAEVLSHVFFLLADPTLLVPEEPLTLLGVQPVTEEAPNLGPYEGVRGKWSDPERAHQMTAELVVGHPALLTTGDVQDLPDRLLTGHGASESRPRVGGMEELEPRVGAELEHDAEILRRRADGHHRREPQDAPVEPGLPDGLLARHLVTPVLVRWGDRRVGAERRLAILDVAEDALGRREDQTVGRPRGLHLLDESPGPVDVDSPGEIGRPIYPGRNDARQMHHGVHALKRRADGCRIGDVAPRDVYAGVEAGRESARPRRFDVEGHDGVVFFEQRVHRVRADVAQRTRHQHLHTWTQLGQLIQNVPVVELDGDPASSVPRAP